MGWLSGGLRITGAANEESGKQYEKWKADQAAKFLAKQKTKGPAPSWRHPLRRLGWEAKGIAYDLYNDHQQHKANSALAKGAKWQGRLSRLGKGLGVLGAVAAGVDAGMNKWYRDSGRTDLSTTERVGRSIISGVTTAAGSFVGGYYGAASRGCSHKRNRPWRWRLARRRIRNRRRRCSR